MATQNSGLLYKKDDLFSTTNTNYQSISVLRFLANSRLLLPGPNSLLKTKAPLPVQAAALGMYHICDLAFISAEGGDAGAAGCFGQRHVYALFAAVHRKGGLITGQQSDGQHLIQMAHRD